MTASDFLQLYQNFLMNEHAQNLQKMLAEYSASINDDSLLIPGNDTVNLVKIRRQKNENNFDKLCRDRNVQGRL